MKIRVDGNIGANANVGVKGGASSKEVRRLRKELRRGLKRIRNEVKKSRRSIREDVRREVRREVRRGVRRELRNELYSDRFAAFLRQAIDGGGDSGFREIATELLNEAVRVETTGGPVSGTLTEVGVDYMVIQETPTTVLVVPFRNTVSIQRL